MRKKPQKTQVEFNAVTSVLSSTCHGKRQDYDFTHTHLRSYINRNSSKRVHKNVTNCLSVVGRCVSTFNMVNFQCVVYFM